MSVVRCMLFVDVRRLVDCSVLFIVCCSLFVVCCLLLLVVRYSLLVVRCLALHVGGCLLFVVK